MFLRLLIISSVITLASCGETATGDVLVEVRTDFLPGVEFDHVLTQIFVSDSDTPEREVSFALTPDLDAEAFSAGVRVAESSGLPLGDLVVAVALLDGETVAAESRVRTILTASLALTVPITRSCEGVTCPDPERGVCLAGRCVTPGCAAGVEPCDFRTLPFADYPRAFTEAACSRLRRCGGARFDVNFEGIDCVEALSPPFEDSSAQLLSAALERGTLTYDGSLARACAEAAGSISCESAAASFDLVECYDAFQSTGPVDACHLDLECPRDSYCDTSASCPGQCAQRRPATEPCNDDAMCRTGLLCAGATSTGDPGACTEISGTGDPCGPGNAECRADHFCLGARSRPTPRDGTCQPVVELFVARRGDPCDLATGPLCAAGLSCAADASRTTGTCTPHPAEPSGACSFSVPDVCPAGEFCQVVPPSTSGTCTPLPRAGEPCVEEPSFVRCASSHRCVADVCIAMGRIGDECRFDPGCVNGSCEGDLCTAPSCSRLVD